MNEELKTALELCTADHVCCDGCKYFDTPDCEEVIKRDALKELTRQDQYVKLLLNLCNKLAEELQNSLNLAGDPHG